METKQSFKDIKFALDVIIEANDLHLIRIPPQLMARAMDDRGIPIPGTVAVIDTDPIYTVHNPMSFVNYDHLDWNAWAACANDKRCGYCRHPHEYYMYFIGHQTEVYSKLFMCPPMHDECVRYFVQVYPAIFMPRMRSAEIAEGGELPNRLGIYKTRDYKILDRGMGIERNKINYIMKAGTQVGETLWIEYPRDMMLMYANREEALRQLFIDFRSRPLNSPIPHAEITQIYLAEQFNVVPS